MLTSARNIKFIKCTFLKYLSPLFCVIFLIKLRWPKTKSLYKINAIVEFQSNRKKMMDHRTRFREKKNDLPLWRGQAAKKKPPFFNAPALITREIMHSREAQCNTGESPWWLPRVFTNTLPIERE